MHLISAGFRPLQAMPAKTRQPAFGALKKPVNVDDPQTQARIKDAARAAADWWIQGYKGPRRACASSEAEALNAVSGPRPSRELANAYAANLTKVLEIRMNEELKKGYNTIELDTDYGPSSDEFLYAGYLTGANYDFHSLFPKPDWIDGLPRTEGFEDKDVRALVDKLPWKTSLKVIVGYNSKDRLTGVVQHFKPGSDWQTIFYQDT